MGECMSAAEAFHSSWNIYVLMKKREFLREESPPQGPTQFLRAHHSLLHEASMTRES